MEKLILAEVAEVEPSNEKSRTFILHDEGHTLGNALKMIISRYPDVIFCGYTLPHPSEQNIYFRIQAKDVRAVDVLRRGFEDLNNICDVVLETFKTELQVYEETKQVV